jgi:hypothetical protein
MTEKKPVKPKVVLLTTDEERFEVDASKPVKVDLKFSSVVEKDAELLLDLQGDSEVKLGKGTDGNKVIGGASRYAVLSFDGSVFCLKSVCRYG